MREVTSNVKLDLMTEYFLYKVLDTDFVPLKRMQGLLSSTHNSLSLSHVKENLKRHSTIKYCNCLPLNKP